MEIPTHAELVQRIDAFCERHKMAPSRLGRAVTGEPNLVFSIRDGRSPNLDTLGRLAIFMAEQDKLLAAELGISVEALVGSPDKAGETIDSVEPALEGGRGGPFGEAAEAPSLPTCSPTAAPPTRSPGSAASSTGDGERVA